MTHKEFKIPDDCPDEYKDKISYIKNIGNNRLLIILKEGYSTKDVWPIIEYFHKDNIDYVFAGVEGSMIRCMQGYRVDYKLKDCDWDLDSNLVEL